MSTQHLSQRHLAEPSLASARHSQPSLGPSDRPQKHTLPQPTHAHAESIAPEDSLTSPSASQQPTRPTPTGHQSVIRPTPQPTDVHNSDERDLARENAFRRLNGLDAQPKRGRKAPDTPSTATTQPVLVREYSQPSPNSTTPKLRMRPSRNSSGSRNPSDMPPLESFSFQDILASIDPEVHGSIDKIAEICGRSRMSLADEYSSHLPPQGDLSILHLDEHIDQPGTTRLEPVEEASSTHEEFSQHGRPSRSRLARLSLVSTSNRNHEDLISAPVVATAVIESRAPSTGVQEGSRRSEVQASYIPQLLAWLGASKDDHPLPSRESRRNSRATNALQCILNNSSDATTS